VDGGLEFQWLDEYIKLVGIFVNSAFTKEECRPEVEAVCSFAQELFRSSCNSVKRIANFMLTTRDIFTDDGTLAGLLGNFPGGKSKRACRQTFSWAAGKLGRWETECEHVARATSTEDELEEDTREGAGADSTIGRGELPCQILAKVGAIQLTNVTVLFDGTEEGKLMSSTGYSYIEWPQINIFFLLDGEPDSLCSNIFERIDIAAFILFT
jgi:hypothetical protein